MDAGRMAVWEVDLVRDEVIGSPELNRLLGFSEAEDPSLHDIRERYCPGERDRLRAIAAEAVVRGERYFEAQFCYRWPNGEIRWLMLRAEIQLGADGTFVRAIGVLMDVTERHRTENALRESEQRLRETERRLEAVLNNASVSIFLMDERQQCVYMNAAAERMSGYRFEETKGRPLHDVIHHTRPDGSHYPLEECPIDRAFPENNNMTGEDVFVHKDGRFYPVAFTASPVRDETSNTIGTIVEVRDVSSEKAAEQRQRLLINELNHRVKNTLAIVQSIAHQTFKGEAVPERVRKAFEGRLSALSAAHNLLTQENWEAASINRIVEDALAPYAGVPCRFSVSGPDIRLPPQTAVSLALALHELATNATKYGALSNAAGRVEIGWSVERDRLHMTWRELGGPEVTAPPRRGFGTRLIERGLAAELSGEVRIEFLPEGVVCTIEAPLPSKTSGGQA